MLQVNLYFYFFSFIFFYLIHQNQYF
jgi:hypothetical protein